MGRGTGAARNVAAIAATSEHYARNRSRNHSRNEAHRRRKSAGSVAVDAGIPQQGPKPMFPTELDGETAFQRSRSFVWQCFECPESIAVSQYLNMYVLSLIVISAMATVVETVPGLHKKNTDFWNGLETFFVLNFTIEYVGRVSSTPSYYAFFTSGMNYIDVVSILPFYVEKAAGGSETNLSVLRVLRLGRSLRLVKLSRYSRGIRLVTNAMENSLDALQLFFFLLVVVMVVCSSAIYYTERGEYNETKGYFERTNPLTNKVSKSPFQSIPQSFWWCIVTLTTVGYGDTYPVTYGGQIVGSISMLIGLVMLALPLSIIGTNFIEERAAMMQEQDMRGRDSDEEEPSLHAHLDDTIGVVVEVVKYQEIIAEAMGDAIKIIAAVKAESEKTDIANPVMETGVPSMGVAPELESSPVARYSVADSTEDAESSPVKHYMAEEDVNTLQEGKGDSHSEAKQPVGCGGGLHCNTEVKGGIIVKELEEHGNTFTVPEAEQATTPSNIVGALSEATPLEQQAQQDDLIPVDAAVLDLLEILCKNVLRSCDHTEHAISN